MTDELAVLPSVRADAPDIEDKLGFAPYAKTISQIILDDNVETPLTIGIFGSWGSGKTTLMRMVEFQIQEAALQTPPPRRLTLPIWFNAWLYSKEEVLWRALLAQVVTAVGRMDVPTDPQKRQEKNEKLEALKARLYRTLGARELGSLSFAMADLLQSSGSGAQLTLTLQQGFDLLDKVTAVTSKTPKDEDAAESPKNEAGKEQLEKMLAFRQQVQQATTDLEQGRLESLDKFRAEFDKLMMEYVKDEGHLVVFVDDLDRCLPEKAVEVLEAIKLFLDVEGCIFILAIDQAVVERGIQLRYGELGEATEENGDDIIDGSRYLEKIVQIPFVLPPISPRTMGQYVASLAPDLPDPECGNVFAQGLEANPRHVKRAINIFSLLWRLAQNKSELTALVTPVRLAKLVVLQQRHEALYELLRKNPARLRSWESNLRDIIKVEGQSLDRSQLEAELQDVDEEELLKLHGLLTMHDLSRTDMNFADLNVEDVHAYVYLASAVEETATPVQQMAEQTAVPPILPIPEEEETEEAADAPVKSDTEAMVREEQLPQVVPVRSGLEEARLSFITTTVFRDLDKQLSQFDPAQFDSDQGRKMMEMLASAGWQLYDQLIPPDERTALEKRLAEPKLLRVAQGRGEERIPWEIMYDGPPPSSTSQTRRKMKPMPDAVIVNSKHFWGFNHVIERPGSGYGRDIKAFKTPIKPVIWAHIGSDTPQRVEVEKSLREQLETEADGYRPLGSPDEFLRSLSMTSDPSRIYLLRTRAVIKQGETQIGFGSEESDLINRGELRRILVNHFDRNELMDLSFRMNINYDQLNTETINTFAIELIQYAERRQLLDELIARIKESRPMISFDKLSQSQLVLTRQQLESWSTTVQLNAILILDVDVGLVQAEDWSAWLSLFYRMGFAGVVAPTIAPDLGRSWPFIQRFIQGFLEGAAIGEALRDARRWLWLDHYDPSGLFYAHFRSAELRLIRESD